MFTSHAQIYVTVVLNVVISALHKIDKRIHIQAWMQLSKEEYARKRIHNGCLVQIESPVTQDNCPASLGKLSMLNSYRCDRIFNPQFTAIKNSYNKENVKCSNVCYTRIWDIFCPYLCYIQKCNIAEPMLHTKIWYLGVLHFFLHM